jgi:hypothetical protein
VRLPATAEIGEMQMRNLTGFALWELGIAAVLALGLATLALVQHRGPVRPAEMAQAVSSSPQDHEARALALDPEDYEIMQPVCGKCHSAGFILQSRTWSNWLGVFDQMYGYGAQATPDEWNHIYRYTQRNLTLINVNAADEEELSAVLGVDEKTAIEMVRRRSDRKFQSAADVEAVPGVSKARIEAMKPRLLFDEPSESQ